MNVKTIEKLQESIDKDIAWRKHELAYIKESVSLAESKGKNTCATVIRSAIPMLYAHWEGSVKNMAQCYFAYVYSLKLPYKKLRINFLAAALISNTKEVGKSNKTSLHVTHLQETFSKLNEESRMPDLDIISAASNLNSIVFKEIMSTIGLSYNSYETSFNSIDSDLLNLRNNIAHGEHPQKASIDAENYYKLHDRIIKIIDKLSDQIIKSATDRLYLEEKDPSL